MLLVKWNLSAVRVLTREGHTYIPAQRMFVGEGGSLDGCHFAVINY
jgi:hypothetical protein